MKDQGRFLKDVVGRLEGAGIPYMVTGSLGSSMHGEPRATNDIDIVISPSEQQLEELLGSFGEGFYVPAEAARSALRRRRSFNIIDVAGCWKADLIVSRDRDFSREELSRRRPGEILGVRVMVVSPEDVVLSKLEWAKEGESERQLRDAAGVLATQADRLDMAYLRRWAAALGVSELLERALRGTRGG